MLEAMAESRPGFMRPAWQTVFCHFAEAGRSPSGPLYPALA